MYSPNHPLLFHSTFWLPFPGTFFIFVIRSYSDYTLYVLFWKQNKASRGGIIFAWENCDGTKRQGTENMQHVCFCWQCTCCFPPKSLIFLTQRQLKMVVELSTTFLFFVWMMLGDFKFCSFVFVFNLCSSQSSPKSTRSGAQMRTGWWGQRLHTQSCSVSAPCQTICQLSPNLMMICLLNGNMLALIAMHCKIFQYSDHFFFFPAAFEFGSWSFITSSFNDTYFSDTPLSQGPSSCMLKTVCHSQYSFRQHIIHPYLSAW